MLIGLTLATGWRDASPFIAPVGADDSSLAYELDWSSARPARLLEVPRKLATAQVQQAIPDLNLL
jgi:hypothetical protein